MIPLKNNLTLLSRLDYLFILRPMLFFPGWSTMLAGYLIGYKSTFFSPLYSFNDISYAEVFLLLLSFALIMGLSFVLNQIADRESDKINQKLYFISEKFITVESAYKEVWILLTVGLLIGLIVNPAVFALYILFVILTGYLYNFPPAALKNKPWGSLIANALMGWFAFAIGWAANNAPTIELIIDSLPYLFFNTSLYFFTTLPDIGGDESSNKNTLAVKFGINAVITAAFLLYGLSLMSALVLDDIQALFFLVLSIPFFGKTIISYSVVDTTRATKFGILFFALSICLKIPVYFLIMVGGFFATKFYFRYRFNLNYPNFSGK